MFLIDNLIIAAFNLSGATAATVTTLTGAAIVGVGTAYYQQQQQKKAIKSQEKKAASAAESELAFQRYLAGEGAELSKFEMQLQMGQRKIQSLTEVLSGTQPQPRIFTLPSAAPADTWVQSFNREIDTLFRGA